MTAAGPPGHQSCVWALSLGCQRCQQIAVVVYELVGAKHLQGNSPQRLAASLLIHDLLGFWFAIQDKAVKIDDIILV
jgi:hypothetical protein